MTGTLGHTMVPPTGWTRIPVREGSAEAVGALLTEVFHGLPGEQAAEAQAGIAALFAEQIAAAALVKGLDLYVPPIRPADPAPAATILAAEVDVPGDASPEAIVERVIEAKPYVRRGSIDGALAIRIDSAAAGAADHTAGSAGDTAARRVEYVIAVPGDALRRWLSVALTLKVQDLDEATAQEQVTAFDASVAGLRWTPTDA